MLTVGVLAFVAWVIGSGAVASEMTARDPEVWDRSPTAFAAAWWPVWLPIWALVRLGWGAAERARARRALPTARVLPASPHPRGPVLSTEHQVMLDVAKRVWEMERERYQAEIEICPNSDVPRTL